MYALLWDRFYDLLIVARDPLPKLIELWKDGMVPENLFDVFILPPFLTEPNNRCFMEYLLNQLEWEFSSTWRPESGLAQALKATKVDSTFLRHLAEISHFGEAVFESDPDGLREFLETEPGLEECLEWWKLKFLAWTLKNGGMVWRFMRKIYLIIEIRSWKQYSSLDVETKIGLTCCSPPRNNWRLAYAYILKQVPWRLIYQTRREAAFYAEVPDEVAEFLATLSDEKGPSYVKRDELVEFLNCMPEIEEVKRFYEVKKLARTLKNFWR